MSVEERSLRRWQGEDARRGLVCRSLQMAGIKIDQIHETGDPLTWGLFVQLSSATADLFATQREILVWATFRKNSPAAALQEALDLLRREEIRLSQDILIAVCLNSTVAKEMADATKHADITVAALPEALLHNCRPHGSGDLIDVLRPRLYGRDLYDHKLPVTRSNEFFGRTSILDELRQKVRSSQSHIGIFGLRKIGKTSLVNRLSATLRGGGAATVAHIDLQRVVAIRPSAEHVLWHIGEALFDDSKSLQKSSDLKLFGQYDLFADIPSPEHVWELFDHDIRVLMSLQSSPIVIMLDEIERIYPTDDSSVWVKDFVRLWQLLRGIDQENPGRLKFIMSGTNPSCVERHAIFGVDNPIYNYFSVSYLGPLKESEGVELLSSYGRRMGLNWSARAMRRALEDTGGHPALLRTYASMMHRRFQHRSQSVMASDDDAQKVAEDFLIQESSLLAQVVAILEEQYEDEFLILSTLALGSVHEFRDLAREFPEYTAHLMGYGLCGSPDAATHLNIRLLQTYLQKREQAREKASQRSAPDFIGDIIDDEYQVLSLISGAGGFADVYKAARRGRPADEPGEYAAIKIFRKVQLSLLERETETLQEMDHANIVKVLGSGRLADGRVYLAMEYLDGKTLRDYCTAATKPSEARLLGWAAELLDALYHMHPKSRELRELRAQRSAGEETLQDVLAARYGYVHRDIKPENVIVTNRGPVLIDFNISVEANAPVATWSGTPGYLPNLPVGGTWSPAVDLYALGLTLLQVAAGAQFNSRNADDLAVMAASACGPRTMEVLKGLLGANSDGYKNAFTARRAARAARDAL